MQSSTATFLRVSFFRLLLTGCLLVGIGGGLSAQRRLAPGMTRDTVWHKSGLMYVGAITNYKRDGGVTMKDPTGWALRFQQESIERIGWSEKSRLRFLEETISLDSIPTIDIAYLKDGSILRGTIVEFQPGAFLRFRISSGEIRIEAADLERIVQEPRDPWVLLALKRQKKVKPYAFRERGLYGSAGFGILPGGGEFRSQLGTGLQASVGYMLRRQLGLGIGVGLDGYANANIDDVFLPVYVEARGYLWSKKNTPFWVFAAGYGFPIPTEGDNQELRRFDGGYMLHPAIGYRLGGSKKINVAFDIGYKFQKAITEREFFFSGDIITRDILYRRLSLRASLIF